MKNLMINLLKVIFYPIHLISYEKYNFRGFLIYLLSVFVIGLTDYLYVYASLSLIYILLGQKINRKIRNNE